MCGAHIACQTAHKVRGVRTGGPVFPARTTGTTEKTEPHSAVCVKRCLTAGVQTVHCLEETEQQKQEDVVFAVTRKGHSFSQLSVRHFGGPIRCRALFPRLGPPTHTCAGQGQPRRCVRCAVSGSEGDPRLCGFRRRRSQPSAERCSPLGRVHRLWTAGTPLSGTWGGAVPGKLGPARAPVARGEGAADRQGGGGLRASCPTVDAGFFFISELERLLALSNEIKNPSKWSPDPRNHDRPPRVGRPLGDSRGRAAPSRAPASGLVADAPETSVRGTGNPETPPSCREGPGFAGQHGGRSPTRDVRPARPPVTSRRRTQR